MNTVKWMTVALCSCVLLACNDKNNSDKKSANSPPVAESVVLSTSEDVAVVDYFVARDPEGVEMTYRIHSEPTHGTVALLENGNNTFEYLPKEDFNGEDVFTYVVSDGVHDSNVAEVTVSVSAAADKPRFLSSPDHTVLEGGVFILKDVRFTDPDQEENRTITIDWGDGSELEDIEAVSDEDGYLLSAEHLYSAARQYTVSLCILDNAGETCDSFVVNVAKQVQGFIDTFDYYGFIGGQFVKVDMEDASVTPIGLPIEFEGVQPIIQGMSFDPVAQKFFASMSRDLSSPVQLISVDHTNGNIDVIGPVVQDVSDAEVNLFVMEGMAFNPTNGKLFSSGSSEDGTSSNQIFELHVGDVVNAEGLVAIGDNGFDGEVDAMVMNSTDTFVVDSSSLITRFNTYLAKLDKGTGSLSPEFNFESGCSDMAYDIHRTKIICTFGNKRKLSAINVQDQHVIEIGSTHAEEEYNGERMIALGNKPGKVSELRLRRVELSRPFTHVFSLQKLSVSDNIVSATIDWGDGGGLEELLVNPNGLNSAYVRAGHVFEEAGDFAVKLCVKEADTDEKCTNIDYHVAATTTNGISHPSMWDIAVADKLNKIYVPQTGDGSANNRDSIKIIDKDNMEVVGTIELESGMALGMQLSPQQDRLYVAVSKFSGPTLYGGQNRVDIIDTGAETVIDSIGVSEGLAGGIGATSLALTPDGSKLFVTDRAAHSVTVVNFGEVIQSSNIPDAGLEPTDIVMAPDGLNAYVVSRRTGSMKVIDTVNETFRRIDGMDIVVDLGLGPGKSFFKLGMNPNGRYVYAYNSDPASQDTDALSNLNKTTVTVVRIDPEDPTARPEVVDKIETWGSGTRIHNLTITKDGRRLLLGDGNGESIRVVDIDPMSDTIHQQVALVYANGATWGITADSGSHAVAYAVDDDKSVLHAIGSVKTEDGDMDGLSDIAEKIFGADENKTDTDDDGISDGDEVHKHLTSPVLPDSDADGTNDGVEIANGTDPLSSN